MNKKIVLWVLGILVISGMIVYSINSNNLFNREKPKDKPIIIDEYNKEFVLDFIREVNQHENYLVSPYSIEMALNMLKEGTNGETYLEMEKAIGTRSIKDLLLKDKLNIANAAFVKNKYKDLIKTSYSSTLKNKYNADILYDEFQEPTVINNWVKEKTNEMIDKILDKMEEDFAMGIINAVALDVKWDEPFECIKTDRADFIKDDETLKVEMMHNTYKFAPYRYFEVLDAEGVVIPYEKLDNSDVELEFVGILPNNGIDAFLKNLTMEKLKNIDNNSRVASVDFHISVALPRFSYEFEVENMVSILKKLGINQIFSNNDADFSNMLDVKSNDDFYVSNALHKTVIELNEKGTKAAAVTYFAIAGNAFMMEEPEIKNIEFNRPFIYMIRDKESKEILFFGSVYEPNKWEGTTCDSRM